MYDSATHQKVQTTIISLYFTISHVYYIQTYNISKILTLGNVLLNGISQILALPFVLQLIRTWPRRAAMQPNGQPPTDLGLAAYFLPLPQQKE